MRVVPGGDPQLTLEETLERAKQVLPASQFNSYSATALRFFRETRPVDPAFVAKVAAVVKHVETVLTPLQADFEIGLFASLAANKTLLPKPPIVRPSPERWGWMRIKEDTVPDLLWHMVSHEVFHICFETAYQNWRHAVDDLQIFPLWLLKQAAIMNYPFAEMLCDMGAEVITSRFGKPSPTSMVSYLKAKSPLSYDDFMGILKRLSEDFTARTQQPTSGALF